MRFFLSILVSLAVFTSCSSQQKERNDVIVSTPPYLFFVHELLGEDVPVSSLVPEKASPHLYEPSPKEVAKAKNAKVWIRSDEAFEKKLAPALIEGSKDLSVLNLATALSKENLLKTGGCSCHKEVDLHFWLSIPLAKKQAQLIARVLCESFPKKKKQIEENLSALLSKFDALNLKISRKLAGKAGTSILISHPALHYFCKDYGLTQVAVEHEGKEPLPKQVATLLTKSSSLEIQTAFIQPQYSNKGTFAIAEKLSIPVHEIDPYSPNLLQTLEDVANSIAP